MVRQSLAAFPLPPAGLIQWWGPSQGWDLSLKALLLPHLPCVLSFQIVGFATRMNWLWEGALVLELALMSSSEH